MSNVPPDDRPPGSGWQTPSGGYPPPGGGSQQPGSSWQQPPPSPPQGGGYQPPGYGAQHQSGPAGPGGQQLAEWWKRLLAIIIDGLLIGIPLVIVFFVVIGISFTSSLETDPITGETTTSGGLFTGSTLLFQLVAVIVTVAYYGLLNGSDRGQTVGKMALGIRVRDANGGGPIGVGRGAARALVSSLPGQLPFVGIIWVLINGLWPLWDPRRKALHDKAVNSVVVVA